MMLKSKRMTAVVALILTAILLAVLTSACGTPGDAKDKVFTYEEMSLTLTEAFAENKVEGYSVAYASSEVAVFVLKEPKELFDDISFDEYVDGVRAANEGRGFTDLSNTEKQNGLVYFDYRFTNPEQNIEYRYFTTLHESADAFWLVQFVSMTKLYDQYADTFVKWAKTITFA